MTVDLTKAFAFSIITMMALVLGEFALSKLMKKKVFDFSDSLTNLACGILERTIFLLFVVIYYASFQYFYIHFSIAHIPVNWMTNIILFLAVDFLWYWYHRAGHEINILWAAHITHHQSEEYNFTLSFRVSAFQLIIRMFFWLWLPIIGFDPGITTLIIGINAAYQFFIHTRLINRLGILEKIIITPSHHRVHHGKNEVYIDKNYGGILVIWDKLFGTFEEEKEEVKYGITKPMKSHTTIASWFHYFFDLWNAAKYENGIMSKIKIFLKGPETLSNYYENHKQTEVKEIKADERLRYYFITQFFIIVMLFISIYYYIDVMSKEVQYTIIGFIVFTTLSIGFVIDKHNFALPLEFMRLVLMSACTFIVLYLLNLSSLLILAAAPLVLLIPWLLKHKDALKNSN